MIEKAMNIPVAFCASEQYLSFTAVSIWSIICESSYAEFYSVYILHRQIPLERQKSFADLFTSQKNIKIEFINVSPLLEIYLPNSVRIKETWFSLLLAECLPSCEKIIALDSDLIVKRNLSELFQISVRNVYLAAALDPDFIGQFHSGNPFYRRYYSEVVPIPNPYRYFQGGVYLLNLKEIRKDFGSGELIREASRGYRFDDQDVLNMRCYRAVRIISMRWNVLYDSFGYRRNRVIALATKVVREEYEISRKDPWVIHYAGGERPWINPACDFGDAFWQVANSSPVASELREILCKANIEKKRSIHHPFLRAARWLLFITRRFRLVLREGKDA